MPKLLIVSFGTAALVAASAPAAFAQRDPFDPLVTEAGTGTATTTASSDAEPTTTGTTATDSTAAMTGSESLPTTGADLTPWLAGAYALIAVGGAALLLSRNAGSLHRRVETLMTSSPPLPDAARSGESSR